MPRLTIDGAAVEVDAGASILDAATKAGIEIPTLCHVKGLCAQTSCMICVVKDEATGRALPSCSARAEDGMRIDTRCDEIVTARREVLELLLSEHVGDCEAPCRSICPAFLDIPAMMARMSVGDFEGAGRIAQEHLAIPGTLGYLCSAPCERGCHRAVKDSPLAIRETHRRAAEEMLASAYVPAAGPATGKRVAIVGASAAGLATAYMLRRRGHSCRVFEKTNILGRMLRENAEVKWDEHILDTEIERIRQMGVEFECNSEVGAEIRFDHLVTGFDAVVITCDELDADADNVFYAVEYSMAVNAVGEGKAAADQADRFLRGLPSERRARAFNSRLVTLRPEELDAFLTRLDPGDTARRSLMEALLKPVFARPGKRSAEKDSVENPQAEAARCMQCQCMKPAGCKLRQYATEYGAGQAVYHCAERSAVEPTLRFGEVVFEPGKCIRCGLCVELGKRDGVAFGLAFSARGGAVGVPFERDLEAALKTNGPRCVEICPTGALAFRQGETSEP
ncbi:MAG: 2Fe-2S iron-sulfur cluster-binding protein [FCB group bacterium]|jgi:ferredoxin|nr:2Fe-2S iron-sulfur cluster-binding protein [FCB group bacterium]